MGKKYLNIGAGGMSDAIAWQLLQNPDTERVILLDKDETSANLARKLNDKRVEPIIEDASNTRFVADLMKRTDAAIGAASYKLNESLTRTAIETGTHFIDLGGNNTVVEKQFAMHKEANKAGVKIIPDCGIAPGFVSILTELGIKRLGIPDYVRIRVGGLPQHPKGWLGYMKVFSIEGLFNEYIEETEVLEDYKMTIKESMTGLETLVFKDFPETGDTLEMEAAYTSGGSSTQTRTYENKIRTFDYKTIRFPGHFEKMLTLKKLGLMEETALPDGQETTMRKIGEELVSRTTTYKGKDMILARITLGYQRAGKTTELEYNIIDLETDIHTAMQRTTGYSAAVAAQGAAYQWITKNGVIRQDEIPPQMFIDKLKATGIEIKESIRHF